MRRPSTYLLIFLALAIGFTEGLFSQKYIQIDRSTVNIRSAPRRNSRLVAKAKRGDVFQLKGESRNWYEIHLFSAKSRYVYKTLAKPFLARPTVPKDRSLRKEIFRAWKEAGARAYREAEKRYPGEKSLAKRLDYAQLLSDRYKLECMQRYGVHPAAYRHIMIEGSQKGW